MAGLRKVKGLRLQPTTRFSGTINFDVDEEEIPFKKWKLEVKERATKVPVNQEEISAEESNNRMSTLDKLIINLNQEYPVYKTYREGTKYQYTTV